MDQAEILKAARAQIESDHAELEPGKRAFNISGALAALEKYGPGIVAALLPVGQAVAGGMGADPAVYINAVVSIVNLFASGGAPAGA